MPTIIDTKFAVLRASYSGSISDMTIAWLQDNGATSSHISDAWKEMLADKLVATPTGNKNDDWFQLLDELGFSTGSLNDRELAFWVDGGTLPA